MSGFFNAMGGGSSQPGNPDQSFENLGFSASGAPTALTTGSANTKSSYVVIGTTSNAWCGFWINLDNNAARWLIDISIDGGSTVAIPDIPLHNNSAVATNRFFMPLSVPAGSDVRFRAQSSTGSLVMLLGLQGVIANAALPPGFSSAEAIIAADTANTYASATNVAFSSSGPTWTELNAATSRDYGALFAMAMYNGTNQTTNQRISPCIGVGGSGSETEIGRWIGWTQNSASGIGNCMATIPTEIASGSRVSAGILAGTPSTNNGRIGLIGFHN